MDNNTRPRKVQPQNQEIEVFNFTLEYDEEEELRVDIGLFVSSEEDSLLHGDDLAEDPRRLIPNILGRLSSKSNS